MAKIIDLKGKRFGRLVVVEWVRVTGNRSGWKCLCDCGKTVSVDTRHLNSGATKSCGCLNLTDLKGKRFGRLVAVKSMMVGDRMGWECLCDCGNITKVTTGVLNSGNTKSCGCLSRELSTERSTTHGLSGSRSWLSWSAMKKRCLDENSPSYPRYGGRGIKVCDRWLRSFENFYVDMGERSPGLSIDRIDNNGDYTPENCRWTTSIVQNRNTRKLCSTNTSGYRGVSYDKKSNRWVTKITVNYIGITLGYYTDPLDAAKAYDQYVIDHNLEHTINGV